MKQSFQPFHFGIKTSSVFHCDPELPRLPHIQNARRQIVAAPVTNLRERRKVKYAARRLRVGRGREKKFKGGPELYRFPCPLLSLTLPLLSSFEPSPSIYNSAGCLFFTIMLVPLFLPLPFVEPLSKHYMP